MKRLILIITTVSTLLTLAGCSPSATPAAGSDSLVAEMSPTADLTWELLTDQVQPDSETRIDHPDGLVIEFPGGTVSTETEVLVSAQPGVSAGDVGNLVIPGRTYSVEIVGDTPARLISITIPYDESLIPADRSEGELFAVYLDATDVWQRVYGDVDTAGNTISVSVSHVSVWSWGYDASRNFTDGVKNLFGINTMDACPLDAVEALDLVERRRTELNGALQDVEAELETLAGMVDESVKLLIDTVLSAINPFDEEDLVGYGLAFISQALAEAFEEMMDIAGLLESGANLLEVSMQAGAVLASMTRAQAALNRFSQAQAIKYAFLFPEAQSAPGYLIDIYSHEKLCEIVADADNEYPRGVTPEPECALWFVLAEVTYDGLGYSAIHEDQQTAIDTAIRECSAQNGTTCQVFRDPICEAYE